MKSVWYVATLALDDASYVFADRPAWMDEPFFRRSLQPALQKPFDDPVWREKTLAAPGLKSSREALKMNQRNLAILFSDKGNVRCVSRFLMEVPPAARGPVLFLGPLTPGCRGTLGLSEHSCAGGNVEDTVHFGRSFPCGTTFTADSGILA